MFKHEIYDDFTVKNFIDWLMLAFVAGNINAGGFLACERFVSHITGFATLAGIDVVVGRLDAAFGILSIPVFFLIGVMVASFCIDRRKRTGKRPLYALVMFLEALCLFAAAAGGYFGFFGQFGDVVRLSQDYVFLALLCLASGLQNAAITTASGSTIRTTHLTGVTTDLGIGFIRVLFPANKKESDKHRQEVRANTLRIGVIFAFAVGSAVGAVLYFKFKYLGFILPGTLALYFMIIAISNDKLSHKTSREINSF